MKYIVAIARSAQKEFGCLAALRRSSVKKAMRKYLETAPQREGKSKIKRLRGLRQPQYRLRVDEVRVYYDVNDEENRVEVLGFVLKPQTADWLREHGVPE
jgi:mRNA-degrading endonuclease RelE of RelBE toxin-antitoxin system